MVNQVQKSYARPEWFDRNPLPTAIGFHASGVAPHGNTVRATYTCPASRKAWISSIFFNVVRLTAAAPAGEVILQAEAPTAGVSAAIIVLGSNGVGDRASDGFGQSITLRAADIVRIITQDTSTGGTCRYDEDVAILEYDA